MRNGWQAQNGTNLSSSVIHLSFWIKVITNGVHTEFKVHHKHYFCEQTYRFVMSDIAERVDHCSEIQRWHSLITQAEVYSISFRSLFFRSLFFCFLLFCSLLWCSLLFHFSTALTVDAHPANEDTGLEIVKRGCFTINDVCGGNSQCSPEEM